MAKKSLRGVLIDLSGTIHVGDSLIPRCNEALEKLISSKTPYRFVTNTTKESKKTLIERLRKLNLDIDQSQVYTSLASARNYIVSRNLRPHLLLSEDALSDFQDVPNNDPNAVLFGLAPEKFNYEGMNEAFQYVLNGAELIAVHKARYYKRDDGLALGPGPFVTALEYATNSKAVVIGKPESEFFLGALDGMGCGRDGDVFMIGDDVRDDIHGAQKVGFKGILVKTGKYRDGDELKIDPPPFLTVESFTEAVDYLLDV